MYIILFAQYFFLNGFNTNNKICEAINVTQI